MNQARTTELLYPATLTDLYSTYSAVDGCPQYLDLPSQATDCYVIIDRVSGAEYEIRTRAIWVEAKDATFTPIPLILIDI